MTASGAASRKQALAERTAGPRRWVRFFTFSVLLLTGIAVLIGLGVWQLERRIWKLDLIAQVERRVHAEPVAAPGTSSWPHINAADDAYRRVRVTGHFTGDRGTLVQAVTEFGGGYWVLAPFRTDGGFTVFVNRGFVPTDEAQPFLKDQEPGTKTSLTGLLRVSEPGGAFLRHNDPAADRWYSRDVRAIAAARGIGEVAPYFIDADASDNREGAPVGGLTVISFPNNHLIYALTWFGLAALLIGWTIYLGRQEWRASRASRRMEQTGR
jgi:surfeit locus 1 family protein